METSFRFTKKRTEIECFFEYAYKNELNFLLWQKEQPGAKEKEKVTGRIQEVDLESKTISFDVQDSLVGISQIFPLYINCRETPFLAKGQIETLENFEVVMNLPKECYLEEKREYERVVLAEDNREDIEVMFYDQKGQPLPIKSYILDISEGGAAIYLTKENLGRIDITREGVIEQLDFRKKMKGKSVAIRSARKIKNKNLGHGDIFALGLEFV